MFRLFQSSLPAKLYTNQTYTQHGAKSLLKLFTLTLAVVVITAVTAVANRWEISLAVLIFRWLDWVTIVLGNQCWFVGLGWVGFTAGRGSAILS